MLFSPFAAVLLVLILILMGFNVLREYERAVIFRWGRLSRGLVGGNGPGVVIILPVVLLVGAFSLLIVGMGLRAMGRRPVTGREEMVGLVGIAKTALAPHGQLAVHGELWEATSDQPLRAGDEAEVVRMDGLRLYVKPLSTQKEA